MVRQAAASLHRAWKLAAPPNTRGTPGAATSVQRFFCPRRSCAKLRDRRITHGCIAPGPAEPSEGREAASLWPWYGPRTATPLPTAPRSPLAAPRPCPSALSSAARPRHLARRCPPAVPQRRRAAHRLRPPRLAERARGPTPARLKARGRALACMRDDSSASGVHRAGGRRCGDRGATVIGALWAGHGIRSSAHAASAGQAASHRPSQTLYASRR